MDEVDYDTVNAQLKSLAESLRGADEATVAAEMERLEALAEQIADEESRKIALIRVRKLPELVSGPKAPTSPEFQRASTLLAQVLVDKGTPAERIAHAERVKSEIGAVQAGAGARVHDDPAAELHLGEADRAPSPSDPRQLTVADDYIEVSPQTWEYRLVAAVVRKPPTSPERG